MEGHVLKFVFISLAFTAVFLEKPAYGASMWDCDYVHESQITGTYKSHDRYQVGHGELRLVNGVARYRVTTNDNLGLMATRGSSWNSPINGPTIVTEVIAINKPRGEALRSFFYITAKGVSYAVDKGTCRKID